MTNLHPNQNSNRHSELEQMLHNLKLPAFATAFSALAIRASKENLSHEVFLYELARLECEQRNQRRIERHLHQSRLPREKTLQSFQLESLTPALRLQVEGLKSGQFVEEASNVIVVGPPGVGKSHIICGIAHELIKGGKTVLWNTTSELVQRLLAAKRDLRLPQELARLDRIECVILDDIGYVQQDRDEMEVLFTFLAERYERKSVMITTNLVFSEWERIFKDPMTTLAALDRVIHHSVVLDMTGLKSFRAKQAQENQIQGKISVDATG